MTSKEQLILIDGSSFVYRAFFAASKKSMSNAEGQPTGATFFYIKMLQSLKHLTNITPSHIAVVFDAKGKNFRHELYSDYKATRPPMPEELVSQLKFIHALTEASGYPVIQVPGVEADDVLGTYATQACQRGIHTIICTGDKDLAQLVQPDIVLYDAMHNIFYNEEEVQEKYGVKPNQIIDLLALEGDTADNIPGMRGTGTKTAVTLLENFAGIYQLKEHIDQVEQIKFRGSKTFAAKFLEQWDQIELSYRLATINTNVENLPLSLEQLLNYNNKEDDDKLIMLFNHLGFASMAKHQNQQKEHKLTFTGIRNSTPSLEAPQASTNLPPSALSKDAIQEILNTKDSHDTVSKYHENFSLIYTAEDLTKLCADLRQCSFFSISLETNELPTTECTLIGLSFCTSEHKAYYLPLRHNYLGCPQQIASEIAFAALAPIFSDPKIAKVGHDIKKIKLILHFTAHLEIHGFIADTMMMAHNLNSTQKIDLDELVKQYLGYDSLASKSILEKKLSLGEQNISTLKEIACEKAHMSFRLYQHLLKETEQMPCGKDLIEQDIKALDALYEMEKTGAFLDVYALKQISEEFKKKQTQIRDLIFEITEGPFNLASVPQLSSMLFEKLAIPYPKKTTKKNKEGKPVYSTSVEILSLLEDDYPIVKLIMRERTLAKLISTYSDKFPHLISKTTGRIHTQFNLAGTATGRLSSSDPNLQNIPIRTPEGRRIRESFTAPQGYKIVSADYSQIELRLIAHFSGDENLCVAFKDHKDIHRATAAEVLGKPIEEVTDEERAHAKSTNFGLMYGMSSHGLSKQTNMSRTEAKAYIDKYFAKYTAIHDFMDKIVADARQHGYITTLAGRHVTIPGINDQGIARRQAERSAINAPMQGSAADIIRKAMVVVYDYIQSLEPNAVRMTLQVHDELVFEVRDDMVEEFSQHVRELMENVVSLNVPLEVSVGSANNWGAAH